MKSQELLKTAAAKMVQLDRANKDHEKREHATRLIYKQAELGMAEIPRTYDEMQAKIASLMNQNLTVVEKAIELTGGNMSLGSLSAGLSSDNMSPEEAFVNAVRDI